jgi:acetamidase/formamidase
VITIYESDATGERDWAKAVYNFRWVPQTDPFGVVHKTIDYPGVPADHSKTKRNFNVLKDIRIPIRPHFGVLGVAPSEADVVDSIPPSYTGGNIDNWRIGKGATMFYPVAVDGALFSAGDPHAAQGDSELCGTAIECSLTGTFQLILHKAKDLKGTPLQSLSYPLLETQTEYLVHGFSFRCLRIQTRPVRWSPLGRHKSGGLRVCCSSARGPLRRCHWRVGPRCL